MWGAVFPTNLTTIAGRIHSCGRFPQGVGLSKEHSLGNLSETEFDFEKPKEVGYVCQILAAESPMPVNQGGCSFNWESGELEVGMECAPTIKKGKSRFSKPKGAHLDLDVTFVPEKMAKDKPGQWVGRGGAISFVPMIGLQSRTVDMVEKGAKFRF